MVQPAAALTTISIPFVSTGCTAFMEPLANTACTIEEFNSASAFANSAETLDISFPLSGDSLSKGSLHIGSLTLDTVQLPFGSVDLAFPAINQAAMKYAELNAHTSSRIPFNEKQFFNISITRLFNLSIRCAIWDVISNAMTQMKWFQYMSPKTAMCRM